MKEKDHEARSEEERKGIRVLEKLLHEYKEQTNEELTAEQIQNAVKVLHNPDALKKLASDPDKYVTDATVKGIELWLQANQSASTRLR